MSADETLDSMRAYAWKKARAMGLSLDDADDAAQEAVLKVWRRMPTLDPLRDPWPLLCVIARQEVSEYARRVYDRRETPMGAQSMSYETAPPMVAVAPPAMSPEMVGALDTLTERQREILLELANTEPPTSGPKNPLYYGNVSTVAARLGTSDANIRASLKVSIPKLRAALEGVAA